MVKPWQYILTILVFQGALFSSCSRSDQEKAKPFQLEVAKAEDAGMSSVRLHRVDTFLQKAIRENWLPGAVYLVARHGKIIGYKSFGFADIENHKPLEKDAIFRLASMSKAIVSVGIMTLYEEGYFVLDEPVSDFIPAFKNPRLLNSFNAEDSSYTTRPASRQITFRDLLTHTSGISYGSYDNRFSAIYAKAKIPFFGRVQSTTSKEVIEKLAALPVEHNPGEKFTYGLSTDVLGYLIEVISGMPFSDFIEQRICKPLGMNDTYFQIPADKAGRVVKIYSEVEQNKLVPSTEHTDPDWLDAQGFPLLNNPVHNSGGSGMSGTAKDYAIFLQMLLNGGEYNGHRILGRKTVELMCKNQIGDIPLGELGQHVFGKGRFGLGFSITTDESSASKPASVGRLGWGGYFGTLFWFDPKEDLLAVLMIQVAPSQHDVGEKFEILTYQAIEE